MAEVLLTGYPSFLARMFLRKLLNEGDHVRLLVRHRFRDDAEQFVATCTGSGTCETLVGDVVLMDLGLTGPQVRRVLQEVEIIYHLATIYPFSNRVDEAHLVNVEGTRKVLDLALSADRLIRFNFLSTAFVSGNREGVVLEEELDRGQRFRNAYEKTKFEAEKLVQRAGCDIATSVFRPSLIVGHSKSGELDRKTATYRLLQAFLRMPVDIHLPLPGRGDFPLNLVPVDYVTDAMFAISRNPRGGGRIFHLTDPNPLPGRRVVELIADHADRKRPLGSIPTRLARRLINLPGLDGLATARMVIDHFNRVVIYNARQTVDILRGTDLQCPSFDTYVANMIRYLQGLAVSNPERHYAPA